MLAFLQLSNRSMYIGWLPTRYSYVGENALVNIDELRYLNMYIYIAMNMWYWIMVYFKHYGNSILKRIIII